MKVLCVFVLAALGWSLAEGRNVTKCELMVEVNNTISDLISNTSLNGPRLNEFIRMMVGKIVCHADTVSNLNTSTQNAASGHGHSQNQNQNCTLFGLFQLSSCRFCDDGTTPTVNSCGKRCSVFLDDDIHDDVACLFSIDPGLAPIEMSLLHRLLEITSKTRREECEHLQSDHYFADCA